jgi:hypothetical protein
MVAEAYRGFRERNRRHPAVEEETGLQTNSRSQVMRGVRLCLPIWLALVTSASAQPVFYKVKTLEWMAADSPLIVRASVLDFTRKPDVGSAVLDTIVVRVRETIKGVDRPYHTFEIHNRVYRDDVPHWKETGEDLLIFFSDRNENGDLPAYPVTPRYVSTGVQAIVPFGPRVKPAVPQLVHPVCYTMDLRDPTDPGEILARTREAVRVPRAKPPRDHTVHWPQGAENIDRLVPVDGRLEAQAKLWARSENATLRSEAAKALALFPSAENVRP